MTTCPVCGKPVDPLRAPAVGVRDGKVVSYDSKECALAAETKPTKLPRAPTPSPIPPPTKAEAKAARRRTPAGGVAQAAPLIDSGPVIEIIHEPASGVVTSAADARSGKASTAASSHTDGAIQIADTGHIDDYVTSDGPARGRGVWIAVAVVVVLGGGTFAAYQLGMLDGLLHRESHAATAPVHDLAQPAVVVTIDAATQVTPAIAVDRSREVLRVALRSDSPRVQRVGAEALARTGDPEAVAQLVAALAKETSDTAKLEILYALARGGDKRGSEGLVAALGAPRRDVKAEAAGRLILLGEAAKAPTKPSADVQHAIDTIAQYLDVSQLRLGAAEQLAYVAEPRAVKVLDQVRADPKSTPDDQARAVIALGHAGRGDVGPALRALLDDARFNAFAAAALAPLHDPAARPVLVKQLDVPSLRVGAARSLRRLDPDLDPAPLLAPLLAALTSSKDTDQVQAAEAVLLLAGPPLWSANE